MCFGREHPDLLRFGREHTDSPRQADRHTLEHTHMAAFMNVQPCACSGFSHFTRMWLRHPHLAPHPHTSHLTPHPPHLPSIFISPLDGCRIRLPSHIVTPRCLVPPHFLLTSSSLPPHTSAQRTPPHTAYLHMVASCLARTCISLSIGLSPFWCACLVIKATHSAREMTPSPSVSSALPTTSSAIAGVSGAG